MTLIQPTFILEVDFENIGSNDMRIAAYHPGFSPNVREMEEITECTESNVTMKHVSSYE